MKVCETREQKASKAAPNRISVVSSNAAGRSRLVQMVKRLGHTAVAHSEVTGRQVDASAPSVILYEFSAFTERSFASLKDLVRKAAPVPVIVISSKSEAVSMVRARNPGAIGCFVSPREDSSLERLLSEALSRLPGRGSNESRASSSFIVKSPAMRAVEKTVRRIADSDVTILITGESGSGKEMVARHIHSYGIRSKAPFVKVNCAAIPDALLESELFGYEAGAFTGAATRKLGKFEVADHGTILLDEISEMSQRLQAKLLHVLQDKQFSRLGGNRDIRVDVQVLAATNRCLEQVVEEGRFREDLYFRLKVIDLYVPPLRERREEIPIFVDYFLHRFAGQYRKPVPELSRQLLDLFQSYRWTGNVRELENMVKRIVILGDESSVMQDLLSESGIGVKSDSSPDPHDPSRLTTRLSLKEVGRRAARNAERDIILQTLNDTNWNRRKASRMLGVSYKTLLNKMKDCGLN